MANCYLLSIISSNDEDLIGNLDGQTIQLFTFRLSYHLADLLPNWRSLPHNSTGTCHTAQIIISRQEAYLAIDPRQKER